MVEQEAMYSNDIERVGELTYLGDMDEQVEDVMEDVVTARTRCG